MDGIDLLKAIKKINQDIEAILITGYPTVETEIMALELGAYSYIAKPFRLDMLSLILKNVSERISEREKPSGGPASKGRSDYSSGF